MFTHNYNIMYYFKVFYQYFTILIGFVMILRWYWVNHPAHPSAIDTVTNTAKYMP